jgi:hypothetical protein
MSAILLDQKNVINFYRRQNDEFFIKLLFIHNIKKIKCKILKKINEIVLPSATIINKISFLLRKVAKIIKLFKMYMITTKLFFVLNIFLI